MGDARLLAEHFLTTATMRDAKEQRRFGISTLLWIETYRWPGNVRELENFVERQLILSDEPVMELSRAQINDHADPNGSLNPEPYRTARDRALRPLFEVEYLRALMNWAAGNVTAAARLAHKERRAFGRLLGKHGLRRGDFAPVSPSSRPTT